MFCKNNNTHSVEAHSGWFDPNTNKYITQYKCLVCKIFSTLSTNNLDNEFDEQGFTSLLKSLGSPTKL